MVYNILSPRKQISLVFLLTSLQFNLSLLLTSSNWNTALLRCPFRTCYIKEEYAKISFTFINFFPRFLDPCHISYECLMLGKSFFCQNIHIINNLGGKQHSKWMYFSKSKLHFLTYIWELTHYRGNLNMSICHNFNNVESTINEHVDTLQKTGFLQICAFLFSYLSMVMMHSMVLVSYSMKVYEQYCAQCPGLSILPSPV